MVPQPRRGVLRQVPARLPYVLELVPVAGQVSGQSRRTGQSPQSSRTTSWTGSGPVGVPLAAQNGIQVGFGATASVRGNTVSGNDYTPKSFVACGLLLFEADGVRASANTYSANERDVCNFGKGGGQFNPNP